MYLTYYYPKGSAGRVRNPKPGSLKLWLSLVCPNRKKQHLYTNPLHYLFVLELWSNNVFTAYRDDIMFDSA